MASVFEQVFKNISSDSLLLIIVSVTRKITADYNGILTDNLNILPTYFYILISAHKPEASASAPDYN